MSRVRKTIEEDSTDFGAQVLQHYSTKTKLHPILWRGLWHPSSVCRGLGYHGSLCRALSECSEVVLLAIAKALGGGLVSCKPDQDVSH